jgi:hypothetical protein
MNSVGVVVFVRVSCARSIAPLRVTLLPGRPSRPAVRATLNTKTAA